MLLLLWEIRIECISPSLQYRLENAASINNRSVKKKCQLEVSHDIRLNFSKKSFEKLCVYRPRLCSVLWPPSPLHVKFVWISW